MDENSKVCIAKVTLVAKWNENDLKWNGYAIYLPVFRFLLYWIIYHFTTLQMYTHFFLHSQLCELVVYKVIKWRVYAFPVKATNYFCFWDLPRLGSHFFRCKIWIDLEYYMFLLILCVYEVYLSFDKGSRSDSWILLTYFLKSYI